VLTEKRDLLDAATAISMILDDCGRYRDPNHPRSFSGPDEPLVHFMKYPECRGARRGLGAGCPARVTTVTPGDGAHREA
jgi:hypothetical protein